eukprot:TRINITY_DN8151_c0_g1_i1.p1 TRINITY_DN8151_c0_g1~~TRINITY_DN8151_c0_g1_i1.p1  ORF type:complete len:302 (-),score=57.61 TRINITY_DN8151_c0_g1_i1:76-981(-)
MNKEVLLLLIVCLFGLTVAEYRPTVLMHGLLAYKEAMSHAEAWITQDLPGIYVKNVEIGDGKLDSLFMDINEQVSLFAKAVQSDPKLQKGFNLIGHSQGGLITRAYIERYNNPPVHNYISWAGPNGGQYGTPEINILCPDNTCPWLNDLMDSLYDLAWIDNYMQTHISFATYWKDPFNYNAYLNSSIFLADINNEKPTKNSQYKKNILSLNTMLLIYSETDNIVIPKTSPWFQTYAVGQDTNVPSLQSTDQYVQDWLGLRTLDQSGRLQLKSVPCGHSEIPRDSCRHYYTLYTLPLLNNTL